VLKKSNAKLIGALSLVALSLGSVNTVFAQDTIKVGVLHSLSGTMAISETTLGVSLPALCMASCQHETQYTRLYRS